MKAAVLAVLLLAAPATAMQCETRGVCHACRTCARCKLCNVWGKSCSVKRAQRPKPKRKHHA